MGGSSWVHALAVSILPGTGAPGDQHTALGAGLPTLVSILPGTGAPGDRILKSSSRRRPESFQSCRGPEPPATCDHANAYELEDCGFNPAGDRSPRRLHHISKWQQARNVSILPGTGAPGDLKIADASNRRL